MTRCDVCNRSFATQKALQMHLRDSPVHSDSHNCGICGKSIKSNEALRMHSRDAPGHTQSYSCAPCNRTFTNTEALQMHIRDSPAHNLLPDTPLNRFFHSFPTFRYNPNLPPAESYTQLQNFSRWGYDSPESRESWDRYQNALREEFNMWFGSEKDLGCWHALCRAVRINPLPNTLRDCERVSSPCYFCTHPAAENNSMQNSQAVRGVYVNIIDLIEWARQGASPGQACVKRFRNLSELRRYTKETRRVFRNDLTDSDDGNVVLRHLLRFIFRLA